MSAAQPAVDGTPRAPLAERLSEATPALLFGLRLWVSVCLTLYVSYALQLSEPSWAATTAAIVCQPVLGASLRKASYRMIGTVVGAVVIVVLAAFFRQDRVGFLVGLALWCALCAFVATFLRNFAAYAAALSGYTAAILAIDVLGPIGATNSGNITMLAINRAIEICIGIACAGVVLALTDLGHARRRLGAEFVSLSSAIFSGFAESLQFDSPTQARARARPVRRDLLRRVIALDPAIDTAVGESSDLRYRSAILQNAVSGFIGLISAWRDVALEIDGMDREALGREAASIREALPLAILSPSAPDWTEAPAELRRACCRAARSLIRLEAKTPAERLMADTAAQGMLALAWALNGLTLIVDPRHALGRGKTARLRFPDSLPAFVNAARAFVTIAIVSLFWIETAWSSGVLAITFAAVIVILLPLQGDNAYSASMVFLFGCVLSLIAATFLEFLILPQVTTFPALCLVLGVVLVPSGFLIAWPWQPFMLTAAAVNIIPMISLPNAMVYDAAQFWNSNIAIVAGVAVGAIAMRAIPPASPAVRVRRLLALTLADLRTLARRPSPTPREAWENRIVARLLAVPEQAAPSERAAIAGALSVGVEILRLRRLALRLRSTGPVNAALSAIAEGRSREAIERLGAIDREFAAPPQGASAGRAAMSLRATILVISTELKEFGPYFDGGQAR